MSKTTYNEDYTDDEFMAALTDELQDTATIAAKVNCSHQEAKQRLQRLVFEDEVLAEKIPYPSRFGYAYAWKRNPEYKKPEGGVLYIEPDKKIERQGVLLWNRGRALNISKFIAYVKACKEIIQLSGIQLEDKPGSAPTTSGDAVRFRPIGESEGETFYVPRELDKAEPCISTQREARCVSYCDTNNEPYTVVAVACLVVLKVIFPRTVLDLRCKHQLILDGVNLAEKVIGDVDRKYLLRKNFKFPERV